MKKKVPLTDEKWRNVISSNEKKSNLNSLDGCRFYWHDLRKDEQTFSKQPFGGESLKFWGTFSWNGKVILIEMKAKQNATKHRETLENSQLRFI